MHGRSIHPRAARQDLCSERWLCLAVLARVELRNEDAPQHWRASDDDVRAAVKGSAPSRLWRSMRGTAVGALSHRSQRRRRCDRRAPVAPRSRRPPRARGRGGPGGAARVILRDRQPPCCRAREIHRDTAVKCCITYSRETDRDKGCPLPLLTERREDTPWSMGLHKYKDRRRTHETN